MAARITTFETEVQDDFEDVALLPDSDQSQHTAKAAPSWKTKLLSWLPSDNFTSRDGFEKLQQTDDASEVSRQTGTPGLSCTCLGTLFYMMHHALCMVY